MAEAAASPAVIGINCADRRQLLFSAMDREFLIVRKSDCAAPGSGVTSSSINFHFLFFGTGGITCKEQNSQIPSVYFG